MNSILLRNKIIKRKMEINIGADNCNLCRQFSVN